MAAVSRAVYAALKVIFFADAVTAYAAHATVCTTTRAILIPFADTISAILTGTTIRRTEETTLGLFITHPVAAGAADATIGRA